ncbi:MAG TPA: alpha-galactosidase, partial [Clostridiales bacterium]|nr:alpha-galactosidase [Clostridiales bacterium]
AWSGNWKIVIERNTYNNLRVVGGINDFDFSWLLEGGEIFETPVFVGGFSDKGFGHMSRNMHLYERNCILPKKHANTLRKVLYNSWE